MDLLVVHRNSQSKLNRRLEASIRSSHKLYLDDIVGIDGQYIDYFVVACDELSGDELAFDCVLEAYHPLYFQQLGYNEFHLKRMSYDLWVFVANDAWAERLCYKDDCKHVLVYDACH